MKAIQSFQAFIHLHIYCKINKTSVKCKQQKLSQLDMHIVFEMMQLHTNQQ